MENKITKTFAKIEKLPPFLQKYAKEVAIGFTVPFIRTAGIEFEQTLPTTWTAKLKNKQKIQNHLKQVHAAGMLLVAETVAVFVTSYNLPDDKIPLVKKIEADFVKRSTGSIKATATITTEQMKAMQSLDKGEMIIDVVVTDEMDVQPVIVKVTSAWITKPSKK
jgi:acyl-coenzyme A thioesterase PaaI-like protein